MDKDIRKKMYIKLSYSLLDWEWYDDANTMRVFLHLLLTANRKDQPYHGDVIRRGEALASVEFLADALKISQKNVRTALKHLKKTGEVATRKIAKTTVIRVLSYDKYQSGGNEVATKGQRSGNETATMWQRKGNEVATPIDCNNEENDKLRYCNSENTQAQNKKYNNNYFKYNSNRYSTQNYDPSSAGFTFDNEKLLERSRNLDPAKTKRMGKD